MSVHDANGQQQPWTHHYYFFYKHFFDDAGERQGDERADKDLPPILFRLAHFSFFLSFNSSTTTAGPNRRTNRHAGSP
jgi:hypothetical protein